MAKFDVRATLRAGDVAFEAGAYEKARRRYIEAADYFATHGFMIKAIATYKHAFRLNMLDPEIVEKVIHSTSVVGAKAEQEWIDHRSELPDVTKLWPHREANVYRARLERTGGRAVLYYGSDKCALAELPSLSTEHVSCTCLSPFERLPALLLLGLLSTTLTFRPADRAVGEDDDPFERIRVALEDEKTAYWLSGTGIWTRIEHEPKSAKVEDEPLDPAEKLAAEGRVYLTFGLIDRAVARFKDALKLKPDLPAAKQGLEEARRSQR
ncbi:MAG: hypothetical protein IPG96_18820 [Proteobacteria bacterium]|nr:hypothetical protein [Pseudomonadota bacterium]